MMAILATVLWIITPLIRIGLTDHLRESTQMITTRTQFQSFKKTRSLSEFFDL